MNKRSTVSSLPTRRRLLFVPILCACAPRFVRADNRESVRRWIAAAQDMKQQALSWGDQPYGAVLVKDSRIIGYGPSRVVKNKDPNAHAEREAIKHALTQVDAKALKGAILYSTSRPCLAC